MAITKSIDFFGPYLASTFNYKSSGLYGVSGLVSGGEVTFASVVEVNIAPYSFIQNGLLVEQSEVTGPITVMGYGSANYEYPIYILVSSPDEKSSSGVTVTVVESLSGINSSTIVLAARIHDIWVNPPYLSIESIRAQILNGRLESIPGRISGLTSHFGVGINYGGGGGNQGIRFKAGLANEPDGARRVFDVGAGYYPTAPGLGNSFDIDVRNIDQDFYRTDYVVLRKRKPFTQTPATLELVKGATESEGAAGAMWSPSTPDVLIDATPGNGIPHGVCDDDGRYVIVWANGSNLNLNKVGHDTARTPWVTSTMPLANTVTRPIIRRIPRHYYSASSMFGVASTGPLASEDIYLFRTNANCDGILSGSIITSMTNSAVRPDMVIDDNNYGHIVFQHNESVIGSPNNQIYYMKVDLNNFGIVLIEPRIARGSNSGLNDTDPHIIIDADGHLHITYVRGNASDTFGDIYLLELDEVGVPVGADIVVSSNPNREGVAIGPFSDCYYPQIAITPHGKIYVAFTADGGKRILLYEKTFLSRTGFTCGQVGDPNPSWTAGYSFWWLALIADELGRIIVAHHYYDSVIYDAGVRGHKLDTTVYSNNKTLAQDYINQGEWLISNSWSADSGRMFLDKDGSLSGVSVYAPTSSVYHEKTSSGREVFTPHEQDTIISTICVPPSTVWSNILSQENLAVTHPPKSKVSGYPVVAGYEGDYTGFYSIHQAIKSLKGIGGKIFVRGGYHVLHEQLILPSGVELIADGKVFLDFKVGQPIYTTSYNDFITLVDADKHQYRLSWDLTDYGFRPGDMVYFYDYVSPFPKGAADLQGPTVITQILAYTGRTPTDIILEDNPTLGGYITPRCAIYKTGIRLQGFTIKHAPFYRTMVIMGTGHMIIEDVKVAHPLQTNGIITRQNIDLSFRKLINGAHSSTPFALDAGFTGYGIPEVKEIGYELERCNFIGSTGALPGYVSIEGSCVERLSVHGCKNSGAWYFPSQIDEVPAWVSNEGRLNPSDTFGVAQMPWANNADEYIQKLHLGGSIGGAWLENLQNPLTGEIGVRPVDDQYGLWISGTLKTPEYDSGQIIGSVFRKGAVSSYLIEHSGRIVEPHTFRDDFQYKYRTGKYWVALASEDTTQVPLHYKATSLDLGGLIRVANDVVCLSIGIDPTGGILEFVNLAGGSTAWIDGAHIWSIQSDEQRICLSARLALSVEISGAEDLLQRQFFVGLGSLTIPNKLIIFKYRALASPSTWEAVYFDGFGTYSYSLPNVPSMGILDNFAIYIRREAITWQINYDTPYTLNLTGSPDEIAPEDLFYLWIFNGSESGSTQDKCALLDLIEITDLKAIAG